VTFGNCRISAGHPSISLDILKYAVLRAFASLFLTVLSKSCILFFKCWPGGKLSTTTFLVLIFISMACFMHSSTGCMPHDVHPCCFCPPAIILPAFNALLAVSLIPLKMLSCLIASLLKNTKQQSISEK
jgi:hypothetical protein